MLARDCLEEFKVECDLRRLSPRTTKGYYNNTALFLNYLEKHESPARLPISEKRGNGFLAFGMMVKNAMNI